MIHFKFHYLRKIVIINVTFYRKRSTFQNVWRQSSGTKCTWTLTSNVLKSTPFPIERHKILVISKQANSWSYKPLVSQTVIVFCTPSKTRSRKTVGKRIPNRNRKSFTLTWKFCNITFYLKLTSTSKKFTFSYKFDTNLKVIPVNEKCDHRCYEMKSW